MTRMPVMIFAAWLARAVPGAVPAGNALAASCKAAADGLFEEYQRSSVPSLLPLMIWSPCGCMARAVTVSRWPGRLARAAPLPASHTRRVPWQCRQALSRGHVPDPDRFVLAGAGELLAVRGESQGVDALGVTLQGELFLKRLALP